MSGLNPGLTQSILSAALPAGAATETTLAAILAKIDIYVDNETLGGGKNGINLNFTTLYNYKPGTTKIWLNGIRQKEGLGNDYIENGTNQIVMTLPPQSTDTLTIDYTK